MDVERLRSIGLTPAMAARVATELSALTGLPPTATLHRVTELHRETLVLHDGLHETSARVLPRLVRRIDAGATTLAVGDWVVAAPDPHGQSWVHERITPVMQITRRDADGRSHPVVANVDTALLLMGLDEDFSLRRLERFVAIAQASEALPVVVLTKADIAPRTLVELGQRLAEVRARLPRHVDVMAVNARDAASVARLAPYLGAGQTLVLLGSSGAGKSTLTNTLLGDAVQDTGAVREHDSRGKHTTTARSLHRLPGGACLIDTPGVRALRPDGDEAALRGAFPDIDALAPRCRFRDCTHASEPGCAVREGVEADRLGNWHKIKREMRRDTMTALERQRLTAQWKARGKAGRERARQKRGGTGGDSS